MLTKSVSYLSISTSPGAPLSDKQNFLLFFFTLQNIGRRDWAKNAILFFFVTFSRTPAPVFELCIFFFKVRLSLHSTHDFLVVCCSLEYVSHNSMREKLILLGATCFTTPQERMIALFFFFYTKKKGGKRKEVRAVRAKFLPLFSL